MLKKILIVCILIPAASLILQAQNDEALQKLLASTKPNEHHAVLMDFIGKWKQNIVRNSGENELVGTGKSSINMVFDGRFLEIKTEQKMMDISILSLQYIGYSIPEKTYFLYGIDGFGTGYIFAKGSYDKKKKELTFTGEQMDVLTEKYVPFTITIRSERENKFIYEVYSGVGKDRFRSQLSMFIKTEEE